MFVLTCNQLFGDTICLNLGEQKDIVSITNTIHEYLDLIKYSGEVLYNTKIIMLSDWNGIFKKNNTNYNFEIYQVV